MSDIGEAIGRAMVGAMIAFGVICSAVTALLIFGVPWLWGLLKPLLHSLTA